MLSVDRVMGEETKAANKQLVDALSTKWDREYSEICGYIWAYLSLNLVQDFSLMMWGPWSGNPCREICMPEEGADVSRLETRGV